MPNYAFALMLDDGMGGDIPNYDGLPDDDSAIRTLLLDAYKWPDAVEAHVYTVHPDTGELDRPVGTVRLPPMDERPKPPGWEPPRAPTGETHVYRDGRWVAVDEDGLRNLFTT